MKFEGARSERENQAADDSEGGTLDMCCSERLSGLPQPVEMEALDEAEGLPSKPKEVPPPPSPSPPSEPAHKLPPQGAGSHSLTVRSGLCLFAASQFLVRMSQASPGPEERVGCGMAFYFSPRWLLGEAEG